MAGPASAVSPASGIAPGKHQTLIACPLCGALLVRSNSQYPAKFMTNIGGARAGLSASAVAPPFELKFVFNYLSSEREDAPRQSCERRGHQ